MSKLTRSRIVDILRSGAGLDIRQARELTGRIIEALAAAIAAGEVIELRGLGTLALRERKARTMHDPRTMAAVDVPARRVIFFKPSGKLKRAINGAADQNVLHKQG